MHFVVGLQPLSFGTGADVPRPACQAVSSGPYSSHTWPAVMALSDGWHCLVGGVGNGRWACVSVKGIQVYKEGGGQRFDSGFGAAFSSAQWCNVAVKQAGCVC